MEKPYLLIKRVIIHASMFKYFADNLYYTVASRQFTGQSQPKLALPHTKHYQTVIHAFMKCAVSSFGWNWWLNVDSGREVFLFFSWTSLSSTVRKNIKTNKEIYISRTKISYWTKNFTSLNQILSKWKLYISTLMWNLCITSAIGYRTTK